MMNKLKEGDIIELKRGNRVYTQFPKHFIYKRSKGDWSLTSHVVEIGSYNGATDYLLGTWVVVRTSFEGGSKGHDPYPDGHRVFCEKLDSEINIECNFYQSGNFTAMIKDPVVIGRAEPIIKYEKVLTYNGITTSSEG